MGRMMPVVAALEAITIAVLVFFHLTREVEVSPEKPVNRQVTAANPQVEQRPEGPRGDRDDARPQRPLDGQDAQPTATRPDARAIGLLVCGTVRDPDGKGISTSVNLTNQEDRNHSVISQEAGGFALLGLTPGRYTLHVRAEGFHEKREEIELPTGTDVHRVDVVLDPLISIRIRLLTPDGRHVNELLAHGARHTDKQVRVVATANAPTRDLPMTESRHHLKIGLGSYHARKTLWETRENLAQSYDGELFVDRGPPFFVSAVLRHVVLDTVAVSEPVDELTLVLTPEQVRARLGSVRFILRDFESGDPLRAWVHLSHAQGGRGAVFEPADDNGLHAASGVLPGWMRLQIRLEGYQEFYRIVTVAAGGETDLGTIRLARSVQIKGIVLDQAGQPTVSRLQIYEVPSPVPFGQPLRRLNTRRSRQDGTFTLPRVGRARYLVIAGPNPGTVGIAREVVDTTAGAVENVRLKLGPATKVTFVPNADVSAHVLTVTDARGVPVVPSRGLRSSSPTTVRLPPGSYTLTVHDGRAVVTSKAFTVDDAEARVPFDL